MRPVLLTDAELSAALAARPHWRLDADRRAIRRVLRFAGFADAFAFMTRVALAAERLDHHPDWRNVYGRVEIALATHDAGGLTRLDFELAAAIDAAGPDQDGDDMA